MAQRDPAYLAFIISGLLCGVFLAWILIKVYLDSYEGMLGLLTAAALFGFGSYAGWRLSAAGRR